MKESTIARSLCLVGWFFFIGNVFFCIANIVWGRWVGVAFNGFVALYLAHGLYENGWWW